MRNGTKARRPPWLAIMLATGALLMAAMAVYPDVGSAWNAGRQSHVIEDYSAAIDEADDGARQAAIEAATRYNAYLTRNLDRFTDPDGQAMTDYAAGLDPTGTGFMGYVEVPAIGVKAPIYHGTDPDVLQDAVGHLEGSSLPTGEPDTHAVLTGHRGIPTAKLFTELPRIGAGDIFCLSVLGETQTYVVERVITVEPDQAAELLEFEEGEALCTLVTCTPYGINTHRLLVTGRRIENPAEYEATVQTATARTISPKLVGLWIFLAGLVGLVVAAMLA